MRGHATGRIEAAGVLLCAALLLGAGSRSWGQAAGLQGQAIQQMIQVVLENDPTLASQETLVEESAKLPDTWSGFAVTGLSVSAGTGLWDPNRNTFTFVPAVTLGASFSLADPARVLSIFNLKAAREAARQEYQKIRNALIADLFSVVDQLLKLASQRDSLQKLQAYLEDYANLTEKQVRAGVDDVPKVDKLWDLKERILNTEAERQDVENQLRTARLETAIRLGGDAWEKLLGLLEQIGPPAQG